MRTQWIALVLCLAAVGCSGGAFVVEMPKVPNPLPKLFSEEPRDADPIEPLDCQFMTVLSDYSRPGDTRVAVAVAEARADEFEELGTRVTSKRNDAFWSLMILATKNARSGYIFTAMLSARNMNEGYDPGVTVFRREGEGEDADDADGEAGGGNADGKIPTMYHGLSYGPESALEEQARLYVRQAYAAVFPYAEQLCDLAASDREREESLEEQLPEAPEPL
jgi:hypothetical protein